MKTQKLRVLSFIMCLVATSMMVSCSKSDEDLSSKIVGSWKCVHDGSFEVWKGRRYVEDKYVGDVATFKEDATYKSYGRQYLLGAHSDDGEWTIIEGV